LKTPVEHTPTIARINVMPIVGVALVLVIILLIAAPFIAETDNFVNQPEGHARAVDDEVRLSIAVGRDGGITVDGQVVARKDLVARLSARIAGSKDKNILVVVRADEATRYQTIREILKDARTAGARRSAIAIRQRGRVN
jgi:biopolymer transport protein ExbD